MSLRRDSCLQAWSTMALPLLNRAMEDGVTFVITPTKIHVRLVKIKLQLCMSNR